MGLGDDCDWIVWGDDRHVLSINADVTELPAPPPHGCGLVQVSRELKPESYGVIADWMVRSGVKAYREYGHYSKKKVCLEHLRQFGFVDELHLDCFEMSELPPLDDWFPQLSELAIDQTRTKALDLQVLTRLPYLQRLWLTGHPKFQRIADQLKQLEFLYLCGISIPTADLFDGWEALAELRLSGGKWLGAEFLEPLRQLRFLEIGRLQGLVDIDWLQQLPQLESFEIFWQPKVTAVGDLTSAKHLNSFRTLTMNGLRDVSALASAPNIESIDLTDCPALDVSSLKALVGHPTLKSVWAGVGTVRGNAEAKAVLGHLSQN